MALLRNWIASPHLYLAKSVARLAGDRSPGDLLNKSELARGDPELIFVYFYAAVGGWLLLGVLSGLALTGLTALASYLGGQAGHAVSLRILYFATAFCFVGALDALWRVWLVYAARRRYRRDGRTLDRQARRLVSVAQLGDGALLVQFAAGIAAAVTLW
jgi:hypothetical protein